MINICNQKEYITSTPKFIDLQKDIIVNDYIISLVLIYNAIINFKKTSQI